MDPLLLFLVLSHFFRSDNACELIDILRFRGLLVAQVMLECSDCVLHLVARSGGRGLGCALLGAKARRYGLLVVP